jgi:type II secretion system protein G
MCFSRVRKTAAGFSAVEILVGIALIGLLSAILVPNLRNVSRVSRQRRTMADMQTLATAIEAYAVDHGAYPAAAACGRSELLPDPVELKDDAFLSTLVPTYIAQPPRTDAWGNPFGYGRDTSGTSYLIQSRGENGGSFEKLRCGPTADFDADIAYSNGAFVQWPGRVARPASPSRIFK